MVDRSGNLEDALAANVRATNVLSKALQSSSKIGAKIIGFGSIIGVLTTVISRMIFGVNQLNKMGGDMGITAKAAIRHFSRATEALSHSSDEISTLQLSLAAHREGLDGNNISLLKLMNQQKLFGKGALDVVRTMAGLKTSTNMSTEAIAELSEIIIDTSQKRAISADKLLTAIDGLASEMAGFEALGLSEQMTGAITKILGVVGPAFKDPLIRAIKWLTATDTLGKVSLVGAQAERAAMASVKTSEGMAALIMRMMVKTGAFVGDWVDQTRGGIDQFTAGTGAITSMLGKDVLGMAVLAKAYAKGIKSNIQTSKRGDISRMTLQAIIGRLMYSITKGLIPMGFDFMKEVRAGADLISGPLITLNSTIREWGGEIRTAARWLALQLAKFDDKYNWFGSGGAAMRLTLGWQIADVQNHNAKMRARHLREEAEKNRKKTRADLTRNFNNIGNILTGQTNKLIAGQKKSLDVQMRTDALTGSTNIPAHTTRMVELIDRAFQANMHRGQNSAILDELKKNNDLLIRRMEQADTQGQNPIMNKTDRQR